MNRLHQFQRKGIHLLNDQNYCFRTVKTYFRVWTKVWNKRRSDFIENSLLISSKMPWLNPLKKEVLPTIPKFKRVHLLVSVDSERSSKWFSRKKCVTHQNCSKLATAHVSEQAFNFWWLIIGHILPHSEWRATGVSNLPLFVGFGSNTKLRCPKDCLLEVGCVSGILRSTALSLRKTNDYLTTCNS